MHFGSGRVLVLLAVACVVACSDGRAQRDERLTVQARINGQPVEMIVDTGAGTQIALWGLEKARALGLHPTPPPAGTEPGPGQTLVWKTEIDDFELEGQAVGQVEAAVVDAPGYVAMGGRAGLVGWPFLRQAVTVLADGQFRLVAELPPVVGPWTRFRISDHAEILVLEIPDGDETRQLLVDTGNPAGVSLPPVDWRQFKAARPNLPLTLTANYVPSEGIVVREVAWADELTIAGLTLTGVPVREADAGELASAPGGSMGLTALRRMDLVVDGPYGIAYVRLRPDRPAAYEHNRLGAVFVPQAQDRDDLVAAVVPGSPAAEAGIRDGDVLLKLDNLDVTPWRTQPGILPLSRFFDRPAGTALRVTVRRDGVEHSVEVTLRDLLGPPSRVAEKLNPDAGKPATP